MQASIMSNQQKPAPPGPCNRSEGVSFNPTGNFSLPSAEGTNESFCQAPLTDMAWKWLTQVGAGSWELRASSPGLGFLTPSFSTGLPHLSHPQGVWLQESVNSGCLRSTFQSQGASESISLLCHLFLCGGNKPCK